jgi:hypothetical protein
MVNCHPSLNVVGLVNPTLVVSTGRQRGAPPLPLLILKLLLLLLLLLPVLASLLLSLPDTVQRVVATHPDATASVPFTQLCSSPVRCK